MRSGSRTGRVVGLALALAVSLSACGTASQPRYGTPMDQKRFQDLGAVTDASRAFPVAFMATPRDQPEFVEVDAGLGGTKVATAQWLTELARVMNTSMAKIGLFDDRFQPIAQELFRYEVESGDMVYGWKQPEGFTTGSARLARLHLRDLKAHSDSDGVTALIHVQVDMTGFTKIYECEKTSASLWDREVFACVGEKILGDPKLWQAATFVP
jgi:hypothetical protein